MGHIERNPCTLRYTYSYTFIHTLHMDIHRITDCYIKDTKNNTRHSKYNIHTEKTPTLSPVAP